MTGEVFVDTAAWVALFDPDDGCHGQARRVWTLFGKDHIPLLTTDFILDETVTYLRKRAGFRTSVGAGEAMFESHGARLLFLDETLIRSAWDRYRKYADKEYSFTDVTSFLVMEQLGIRQAFTFDRHFSQAGFQIVG